jgi:hypothetical protein
VAGAACALPWSEHPRAEDRTRIFRLALENPEGVPLAWLVRTVYSPAALDGPTHDYHVAREFVDECKYLETTRRNGLVWVEPRPEAFHLRTSKQSVEMPDGGGTASPTAETGVAGGESAAGPAREGAAGPASPTGDEGAPGPGDEGEQAGDEADQREAGQRYAKERAQALLGDLGPIRADALRAMLLDMLATELASIEDAVAVLERMRGSGPEYLLRPYHTRFNHPQRVGEMRESYGEAWDEASEQYDEAVLATLTTDPALHDSLAEAEDALLENKNRLAQWLAYQPASEDEPARPGERLPHIWTLEYTDSGLPHLHVVWFGVRWLVPQWRLSRYWGDERGQGRVVHVQRLEQRGGRWVHPGGSQAGDGPDSAASEGAGAGAADEAGAGGDAGAEGGGSAAGEAPAGPGTHDPRGRSMRAYCGKALRSLAGLAEMAPSEVEAEVAATGAGEGGDTWKLALYWALGSRFWGCSPSLRPDEGDEDGEDEGLPHVPCYRFVGVAEYGDLPGRVRREGVLLGSSGPPAGAGTPEATDAGPGPPVPPDERAAPGGASDAGA